MPLPFKQPNQGKGVLRWILRFLETRFGTACYSAFAGFGSLINLTTSLIKHPISFFSQPDYSEIANHITHDPKYGTHFNLIANGIKIHGVSMGQEGAPLMIFLHGFPEFWFSWRAQMAEFSKDYYCVAIDMRGYGESEKPKGVRNYTLTSLIADVESVIQALGYKKAAAVVGHDWGAVVAYTFATKCTNRLDQLIIMNGPHPRTFTKNIFTYPQILKSSYIFFFMIPFLPEFMLSRRGYHAFDAIFGKKSIVSHPLSPDEIICYKHAFSRPGAATAALNYYRSLMSERFHLGWMGKITVPTLLIWGKKDMALTLESNYGLDKYVENLKYEEIEECGHWTPLDQAEKVNQFMREFLITKSNL